jgi:hypothetical protein
MERVGMAMEEMQGEGALMQREVDEKNGDVKVEDILEGRDGNFERILQGRYDVDQEGASEM